MKSLWNMQGEVDASKLEIFDSTTVNLFKEILKGAGRKTKGDKKKKGGINDEPKPLFSLGSEGDIKRIAPDKTEATQDELPSKESPEALFSLH
jgi:hypothetical protein